MIFMILLGDGNIAKALSHLYTSWLPSWREEFRFPFLWTELSAPKNDKSLLVRINAECLKSVKRVFMIFLMMFAARWLEFYVAISLFMRAFHCRIRA